MSHINRNSAENLEYERNEQNFLKQLMDEYLQLHIQKMVKKYHIYVICLHISSVVRRKYAFLGELT